MSDYRNTARRSGIESDRPIWKSHVWFGDACFFVSTIDRIYDTYEGSFRGLETLVWEYDWLKGERGKLVGNSELNHADTCKTLIDTGQIKREE